MMALAGMSYGAMVAARVDHVAAPIWRRFWEINDRVFDRTEFTAALRRVPGTFHAPMLAEYEAKVAEGEGRSGAINEAMRRIRELCHKVRTGLVTLAGSDAEIVAAADVYVREVAERLNIRGAITSEGLRESLEQLTRRRGVEPPQDATLAGLIARLTDALWWRRALRRSVARAVEREAISLGMVHRQASLYASAEAINRRAGQRWRNSQTLDRTEAENDLGEVWTLAELARGSVSNPQVRRAELMTRIAGFEDFARGAGHLGMFYTVTCPGRMHARLAPSGARNPKWDGTGPREAQAYLCKVWARVRAWLARRGAHLYGFRVTEPHHDGTPHWHLLLFMGRQLAAEVTEALRRYFTREDAHELTTEAARGARFKAIRIDPERGSAAGYIAKYVAKNIDGHLVGPDEESAAGEDSADTVRNVDAWASTHGIRQFQQIGGPGVTVWRELRRVPDAQRDLFADFVAAADEGDWCRFVGLQGGVEIARRDRPLQLWKSDEGGETRYREPAGEVVVGVRHLWRGETLRTRVRTWTIRARGVPFAFAFPRTRVNNCTPAGASPGSPVPSVALLRDMRGLFRGDRCESGGPPEGPRA